MKVYTDVQLLCRKRWQNHSSRLSLFFFSSPNVSALCSCSHLSFLFLFLNVADPSVSFLCFRLTENYNGWPFWLWQLQGVFVWPQVHPVRWQSLLHPLLRQPVLKHMWWMQGADRPWRKGKASALTWSDMQSAICRTNSRVHTEFQLKHYHF